MVSCAGCCDRTARRRRIATLSEKIHAEVVGSEKSHLDFTKDETDDVIAKFRELPGAIQETDFKRGRRFYVIRQICASMGVGESYAQSIADQMDFDHERLRRVPGQTDGEFEVAKWETELQRDCTMHHRPLAELSPAELDDVIVALLKYEQRGVVHVHTSNSATRVALESPTRRGFRNRARAQ